MTCLSRFSIALILIFCFKAPYSYAVLKNNSSAVGFYSDGSLLFAAYLPQVGEGFYRLFPGQEVRYGTTSAIKLLVTTAQEMKERYPEGERLQIGDLSKMNGGKLSNHNSHQNGLDIDLIYFRVDKREQNKNGHDDFLEKFVESDKLSKNFDIERNWEYFKLIVNRAKINKIFTDQKIKDELCRYAEQIGELELHAETLRRLRHWPKHDDHFHVRLECPMFDLECIPQALPPAGHGCAL